MGMLYELYQKVLEENRELKVRLAKHERYGHYVRTKKRNIWDDIIEVWVCSNCGECVIPSRAQNYCPNCGAKIEGIKNDTK